MDNRTEREAFDLVLDRVETTLKETGAMFPYVADAETGEWQVTDDGNWCGGHWIGLLWLTYEHTGEELFAEVAREHTDVLVDAMEREAMFCGMNFHYAGFRAGDVTNDQYYQELGLEGADASVAFYHHRARQIPLGTLLIEGPSSEFRGPGSNEGPSGDVLGAVDAIYTSLPILWRAYRETGNPVYRDTAISHADRHLDWYIREDGRTWHHAEFDPETGDLVCQYNELAYSDDTCWARGQGWCIAGIARAYRETEAPRYLEALERTVDYYQSNVPDDLIPYWDFEHPDAPDVPRDTSAAVLTAYGLTGLPNDGETAELAAFGDQILKSLITTYLTPLDADSGADYNRPNGMLLQGCFNGPSGYADRNELIWSDYYLAYTLHRRLTT